MAAPAVRLYVPQWARRKVCPLRDLSIMTISVAAAAGSRASDLPVFIVAKGPKTPKSPMLCQHFTPV